MDSLREQYKTFKNKEMKSGSGYVLWPSTLHQLDRILEINSKYKGLKGSRNGGKKDLELGLDLNEDLLELVDEMKKEDNPKDQVIGQQIKRPRGNFSDVKLKPFEKSFLEHNQKVLDTDFQIEKNKLFGMSNAKIGSIFM